MGMVIDMVTKFKAKQLMNKKLTGREVASILLTDLIQDNFGLTRTYTDAEAQSVYNSLDGRREEYPSFNKWMQIDDVIPNLRNMANSSALSAGYNFNLILSKIRLFQVRWLVDGCEDEWNKFIDAKRNQIGKYGCKPHVVNMFDPLYLKNEQERIVRDAELINAFYKSAIKHLKYYTACIALCEIFDEIVKVNMMPLATSCENMLDSSIGFFNMACDDYEFSQHLVASYPGMKPLIPDVEIKYIDIEEYAPSKETLAKVKTQIEDATKETLLDTCAKAIEEMVTGIKL
ncbi:MAG: hypothetical protein K0R98_691 [Rickettsiaceae bacterium]|jgi:hypothetical protein|nr:hypothetical protein [Rickettsiaceae bacterium]